MYHIHIYGSSRKEAARYLLKQEPGLSLLEDEDGPVGPHPQGQVGLVAKRLPAGVKKWMEDWVALDPSMSFLTHLDNPEDEINSHKEGVWVGKPLALNLEFFSK